MASGRRNNNKMTRRKKLQPATMQMQFVIPNGTSYLDIALAASISNRRSYKQENTKYAVGEFEFLSGGTNGTLIVEKLPETWVYDNAYQKSRALWHKMNDQVLDDEPSIKGKYSDFKILMDSDMYLVANDIQTDSNTAGKILTPVQLVGGANKFTEANFTGAVAPLADWSWSQLTVPNDPGTGATTNYFIHAVGASTAVTKGMIEGYALSRSRPQETDPNVPSLNGWMTELFDVGEQLDELRDVIEIDNDEPPYPVGEDGGLTEFYPGGSTEFPGLQTHSFVQFTTTTVSNKTRMMGGLFQNGLMKFTNNTGSSVSLILHMLPGNHRGYYCEEMD